MSVLINCQSLYKSFDHHKILEDLNFSVFENDKIAIVGDNGSGKSTLLNILAKIESADEGIVSYRSDLRAFYVPQSFPHKLESTILETILDSNQNPGISSIEFEQQAVKYLTQAGFKDLNIAVKELSGGWKKRLEITRGLANEPDVLLLDEPTNHLDEAGIYWLETILQKSSFSWVAASHDRYFIDKAAKKTAEVNSSYPNGLQAVEGGYSDILIFKKQFFESQSKLKQSLSSKVRREEEWLRRGPRARTTKAKFRIEDAQRLKTELQETQNRLTKQNVKIEFDHSNRKTTKLIETVELNKTYGDKTIIENLSLIVSKKNRMGILGFNGSGKSTLLKLFQKELEPDSGKVLHANNLKIVYFDQNRERLDPESTLQKALSSTGDSVIYRDESVHIVTWANRFRFSADKLPLKIQNFSGGEQARVLIAGLTLESGDVLLLDEPTNDLDISTLEILEDSLTDFPGAIIIVSHDRYLMNKVCDTFIGLKGKGEAKIYSDYSHWENEITQSNNTKKITKKQPTVRKKSNSNGKLSYNEQREFDGMEEKILVAESALEELGQQENSISSSNPKEVEEYYSKLHKSQQDVEQLYTRWAELEDKTK
jgi:ATP-binding cassette subfamily F protein uup